MKQVMYNSIRDYFSIEFITALANNLDEPIPGIEKAISAIIPTAYTATRNKAQDHPQIVYSLATDATNYYSKAPDVATLQNFEKGSNLPGDIFGKNEHEVARHIAAYSGLRPTSVSSLIMLVLPVLMGKLGEDIQRENALDDGILQLLPGYGEEMQQLTPEGYSIPDLTHQLTASREDNEKIQEANVRRNKTNYVLPKWVPIALVVLVVILLIYFSRL